MPFGRPVLSRVAQEPNRNRELERSEPFFPKPKAEPEPPEPFSRNRNRNRNHPFLLDCAETQKNLFCRGTAETGNRNRSNRSTPLSFLSLFFLQFLVFSPCEEFLVFLSVFSFFSRNFRGSVGIKNPCFFLVVFLAFFQKKKTRKGRTGPRTVTEPNRNEPGPP